MAETVLIRDRNPDGRGRGALGQRVALVCGGHPGEEVVVRVDRLTRGTAQGRVRQWVHRDPHRIEHPCAHEQQCTGCPLLAVAEDAELAFKRDRVVAAIAAGVESERVASILRPSGLFHYRHYAKQVFGRVGNRPFLGSYVAGTHEVADNCACPVLAPALARLLDDVAGAAAGRSIHDEGRVGLRYAVVRQSAATGEQLLILVTSGDPGVASEIGERMLGRHNRLAGVTVMANASAGNALLAGEVVTELGTPVIEDELLGFRQRIGARSFFQINPAAASSLFAAALAGAGEGECCVDAYAGVGALTLPLTRRFARVVAVESLAESTAMLSSALVTAAIDNVEVITARVEAALPATLETCRPGVVVLDPPRKGIGAAVADMVCSSTAKRVVLLTCGLDALATDLPALCAGGFSVEAVTPVDQFPRTGHVECVTVLSR